MQISQNVDKRFLVLAIFIGFVFFAATTAIKAQNSGLDPAFKPVISKIADSGNFTLQADGKIIVYGNFQVINGTIRNGIARFNGDGSLDNAFNFSAANFTVSSVVVQPDQKILVGGSVYSSATDTRAAKVLRLNADGSLDNSFSSPFGEPIASGNSGATVHAVQPDGKIIISLGSYYFGYSSLEVRRLNADGTFDNSFTRIDYGTGRLSSTSVTKIALLPNGKILIAATASGISGVGSSLQRYNSDGTLDTSFEMPVLIGTSGTSFNGNRLNDFAVLSDGSVIIVGDFNSVNGISRVNIAKLLPAGNVDLTFAPVNVFQNREPAAEVEVFSNGKVLVRNGETVTGGSTPGTTNRFINFNADGSAGNQLNAPPNLLAVNHFVIDSADNIVLNGNFSVNGATVNEFARIDVSRNFTSSFAVVYGTGGTVSRMALQTIGKIIIVGNFTSVGRISVNNIARLNADGSPDLNFISVAGFNSNVETLIVQPDDKILVGGSFTNYNGQVNNLFARLNSDGSLDTSFNPNIVGAAVYSAALQADGKILIGGQFTSVGGQTRNGLARLNADGSLDVAFNPQFGLSTVIRRVLLQPDGKIVAGGTFSGVNGFNRTNLVRLNADGTLDTTFNAVNLQQVILVELQSDGKFIVYNGSLIKLNADGTTDQTFKPEITYSINAISIQPDGSIILGGQFVALGNNSRTNLARLRSDGSVDLSFFPVGANNVVLTLVRQADGRVLIGGAFTAIAGEMRLGAARLNVGQVSGRSTPFDFDGDGRADISVFRQASGIWYQLRSRDNSFSATQFGLATDLIAPADYDGDGRADIAVFRDTIVNSPDKAYFYILFSSDNTFHPIQFGRQGDVSVSADWDGDGKDDLAIYRSAATAGEQSYFYYRPSSIAGSDFRSIPWGTAGDKPLVGDFDGDGKNDATVFRASNAFWYILKSADNQAIQRQFGLSTDVPTPADYDGDGKTNFAVFRPSTGYWYTSTDPNINYGGVQFGSPGDLPVAADYDGDGRADLAVYRPNGGVWYLLRSSSGFVGIQFGISTDRPIPNAFIR